MTEGLENGLLPGLGGGLLPGLNNGLLFGLNNGLYDNLLQNNPGNLIVDDVIFNDGAVPILTGSASTGGAVANARWTLRPEGYSYTSAYWSLTNMNSVTGGSFMFTNSDSQGSPGTNVTNEWIVFGPYDLRGYNRVRINMTSYLRYIPGNQARIEWISTPNILLANTLASAAAGNTPGWNIWHAFLATHGGATTFANLTPVNQATNPATNPAGKSNVYFRFRYQASWDYGWAISRVGITGIR